ncbi:mono-or diacylglycerol acyltransferase type 2 [Tribonema minus]|uniref:Acyltransferase n=1 Tax=Tribonema minus TaxID=303371 RepID=A0A836C9N4_9STRA|nr:mono-or diacylglycerol acyltransferase type 2 [Tribonema minus]
MAIDKNTVLPPPQGWVRMTDLVASGSYDMATAERNGVLNALAQPLKTAPSYKEPQRLSFLQDLAGVLAFLFFPGCLIWVPFIICGGAYLAFRSGTAAIATYVFAMAAVTLWPHTRWPGFIASFVTPIVFRYCSLVYAWEAPLPNRHHILVCPPHGVLPIANLLLLLGFRAIWGFDVDGLTADAALRLPVMRQIMSWVGCGSATASAAKVQLDRGRSIGISPGGVAEIFDVNDPDEVIFMRARKGFVRLALRSGTPLVPCYCFGNTQLFHCWYDSGNRMRAISRRLGFGVMPIWGRFGLPVIYRQPLFAITGTPIEVPLDPNPSAETVDKFHALFLEELQGLFDRHKGAYGWGDKQLVIR